MKAWLRSAPALIALLGLAGAGAAAPPQKASTEKETQTSPQVCVRPVERDAPAEYGLGIEPHGDHGRAGDSDLHPHDTLVGWNPSGEIFVPACEMRCEVDGWKITVAKSLTSNNAIIKFISAPTIYTFGSALWNDFFDVEVAIGTGSDGWCVNFPTAAPDPIIGPVYQREGASSYSHVVVAGPLDESGLGFCAADPMTGEAPIDYLLDVLEIYGGADAEYLPSHYCGDQDCYDPQFATDHLHDPANQLDPMGSETFYEGYGGDGGINGGGGDSANPLRIGIPAFARLSSDADRSHSHSHSHGSVTHTHPHTH